jgi:hypothetical protein
MLTSIETPMPSKFVRDATYRPNVQQLLMNAKGEGSRVHERQQHNTIV